MAATDFPAYVTKGVEHTRVEEYTPSQVAGEVLLRGDFCVWDDSNNWCERCGADPAAILGISEVVSEEARLLTSNGKIPIRRLYPGHVLCMSSATAYVEATHRNTEYGIARSTAGNWRVDVSDTSNVRVFVLDGDPVTNFWYVAVLSDIAGDEIDS